MAASLLGISGFVAIPATAHDQIVLAGVRPVRLNTRLGWLMLGDELTWREDAQAAVGVDGVAIVEPGGELLQDGDGIPPEVHAGVVALRAAGTVAGGVKPRGRQAHRM